jgi:hypothetical protein
VSLVSGALGSQISGALGYRENHQSGAIVQTGRCTGSLRDGHERYQRVGTGQNTATQRSGAAATTDEYLVRRERDNGPRGGGSILAKKVRVREVKKENDGAGRNGAADWPNDANKSSCYSSWRVLHDNVTRFGN